MGIEGDDMTQPRIQGRFASWKQVQKRRSVHEKLRREIAAREFFEGVGMAACVVILGAVVAMVVV